MIYPDNFEQKIEFGEIRQMVSHYCLSPLGQQLVADMHFLTDAADVELQLEHIRQWRLLEETEEHVPVDFFFDCRAALKRIHVANTHLEEDELFNLRRSLGTAAELAKVLTRSDDDEQQGDGWQHEHRYVYPALAPLAVNMPAVAPLLARIDQIMDNEGHIRDKASPELYDIRTELRRTEGSISSMLARIVRQAQANGYIEKDVAPAMRDGRLVIPVPPQLKHKINGIVHDESATGRTVFIEPAQVVEANNRIRELQAAERQEIIRLLTALTDKLRPHADELLPAYGMLAQIDFIRAKVHTAKQMHAIEPQIKHQPHIDWIAARHPLLERRVKVVPLDITLTPEAHILIISGPNAGGKSVCLKTVGLLQYMLQCGLSVPMSERSTCGVFSDIMIDIGDEQSLENDLSTYSSHLLNMKNMLKQASGHTLILIDEFGTGTEPQIGGAIAESVLARLCRQGAWGVITTHYHNLKHFADTHPGVANGAMLYDRQEMRPLFQLAIGQPGSSFAIEIARKIGLPQDVIDQASELVGSDYIQSDKYLQDIVRDKRYWERKRQAVHQREKDMERIMAGYEQKLKKVETERREILDKAHQQATQLLAETNRRIENTIREIKQQQAEKEATRKLRADLEEFKQNVEEQPQTADPTQIEKQIEKIKQRRQRHEEHMRQKASRQQQAAEALRSAQSTPPKPQKPEVGDNVRIAGLTATGTLEAVNGNKATVIMGSMRTVLPYDKLTKAPATAASVQQATTKAQQMAEELQAIHVSRQTQQTIDEHRRNFSQDIDVRGLRGDEALITVQHFIDDAILMGQQRVRILHGKGNGILRQLIRQYLATVPQVSHFADERVQFGGAGITVVDF